MGRLVCLEPLIADTTHTLILGTFPGEESLRKGQYYASPKNHFWDIIYRTYESGWDYFKPVANHISYDKKTELLLNNGLGLWDVIESCERKGSSDSKIRNERINDLTRFLSDQPQIRKLIFSNKSMGFFRKSKQSNPNNSRMVILNSTSSMNPNNTFFVLNQWRNELLSRN